MYNFMNPLLSLFLSGFRKGHNCQNVLLRLIDKRKSNIDNGDISGALLTDLSKAFDCLQYRWQVAKLNAYRFNPDACKVIANYFIKRLQRVKIGNVKNGRIGLEKGAPQGSMFGPLAYMIYSNDFLYLVCDLCDIYNYADDNTICVHGNKIENVL